MESHNRLTLAHCFDEPSLWYGILCKQIPTNDYSLNKAYLSQKVPMHILQIPLTSQLNHSTKPKLANKNVHL